MDAVMLDRCVHYPASGRGVPVAELRLHQALQTCWASLLVQPARHTVYIIPEAELGWGLADLAVADVRPGVWERRAASGSKACIGQQQLLVADTLRAEGPLELAALPGAIGARFRRRPDNLDTVRRAVYNARSNGLLAPARQRGICEVNPAWLPAVEQVAGVEAKMGRWMQAYNQAWRWRPAVDRAWLAFPERYTPRAIAGLDGVNGERAGDFGIIGISDDDTVRIHRNAHAQPSDDEHRQLYLEELLYDRWLRERSAA